MFGRVRQFAKHKFRRDAKRHTTFPTRTKLCLTIDLCIAENNSRGAMVKLFSGERDPEVFGAVWERLLATLAGRARQLIATLLLVQFASWDFRFEKARV